MTIAPVGAIFSQKTLVQFGRAKIASGRRGRLCGDRCRTRRRLRCPAVRRARSSVHQPDVGAVAGRAAVEIDPLDERTDAISHPDDGNSDFVHYRKSETSWLCSSGARNVVTILPYFRSAIPEGALPLINCSNQAFPPRLQPRHFTGAVSPRAIMILIENPQADAEIEPCGEGLLFSFFGPWVAEPVRWAPTYTAEQAVAAAREQNPEILMAAKQLEAAKGTMVEARSGFLPGVVSTGLLRKRERAEPSTLRRTTTKRRCAWSKTSTPAARSRPS